MSASFNISRADVVDYESREYVVEWIRQSVEALGLPVSDGLVDHATQTSHEDFPHHQCGITCLIESRGTTTPTSTARTASERLHALVPPANFGAVIPGNIYRSSYPEAKNYNFIKDLKIKSILTLVPEPISPEYQNFMDEAGIQHYHVHIKANKGKVQVDTCEMSRALRLVMDRSNHPILVHCNKGKHRTGCTIACFRRILGFAPDFIRDEYHTYAGKKARFLDEVFFENYDLNLVMWMARLEKWVAPKIDVAPPSPPVSPTTKLVTAKPQA